MAMKINIIIPSVDEVVAELDPEQAQAAVEAALKLEDSETAMREAREQLNQCSKRARELREQAPRGQASMADLEAALAAERAAAVAVPSHEERVREAGKALERAQAVAREASADEARRRASQLQRIADELAPALEALREAEHELQSTISSACSYTKPIGNQDWPVKGPDLEPVSWPASLKLERQLRAVGAALQSRR